MFSCELFWQIYLTGDMPLHSDGDELSVDEIMQEISITISDDLLCRMNEGELTKSDIGDAMYQYLKRSRQKPFGV